LTFIIYQALIDRCHPGYSNEGIDYLRQASGSNDFDAKDEKMKKEREPPTQAQLIFELFQSVGEEGLTSHEVANALDLAINSVSTRISQLRRACCITETPLVRKNNGKGTRSVVYQAIPQVTFERFTAYVKNQTQHRYHKNPGNNPPRIQIQDQIATEVRSISSREVLSDPSLTVSVEPKVVPQPVKSYQSKWETRVLRAADNFRKSPSKRNRKNLLTVSRFMV
jgi:hypothetical protein